MGSGFLLPSFPQQATMQKRLHIPPPVGDEQDVHAQLDLRRILRKFSIRRNTNRS